MNYEKFKMKCRIFDKHAKRADYIVCLSLLFHSFLYNVNAEWSVSLYNVNITCAFFNRNYVVKTKNEKKTLETFVDSRYWQKKILRKSESCAQFADNSI